MPSPRNLSLSNVEYLSQELVGAAKARVRLSKPQQEAKHGAKIRQNRVHRSVQTALLGRGLAWGAAVRRSSGGRMKLGLNAGGTPAAPNSVWAKAK